MLSYPKSVMFLKIYLVISIFHAWGWTRTNAYRASTEGGDEETLPYFLLLSIVPGMTIAIYVGLCGCASQVMSDFIYIHKRKLDMTTLRIPHVCS